MNAWTEWRNFVVSILSQGRLMTPEERQKADELVKRAKAEERREYRKQKRLAQGREWVE